MAALTTSYSEDTIESNLRLASRSGSNNGNQNGNGFGSRNGNPINLYKLLFYPKFILV